MTQLRAGNPPFLERGQGEPTLVFLHYFSGASASWQWVIDELPEFHCVALDLPGFGQAPPLEHPSIAAYNDYIWETLTGLGVDHFVLIGHSMGGKIALQVAASSLFEEPHHVVLVAPSPPTQEPMPAEERERLLSQHSSPDNAATTVDKAVRQPLTDQQRAIAIESHTRVADSAWVWWLQDGMNRSIADQMANIRVPVTVLASQDDPVIPFETIQREVMELLKDAQLIELSGIGHLIPLEAPKQVAQTIRDVVRVRQR